MKVVTSGVLAALVLAVSATLLMAQEPPVQTDGAGSARSGGAAALETRMLEISPATAALLAPQQAGGGPKKATRPRRDSVVDGAIAGAVVMGAYCLFACPTLGAEAGGLTFRSFATLTLFGAALGAAADAATSTGPMATPYAKPRGRGARRGLTIRWRF